MDAVRHILDGLEAALELERELGVWSVEIDRALLASSAPPRLASPAPVPVAGGTGTRGVRPEAPGVRPEASEAGCELVFLHDRPLSAAGVEMMAKILNALGRPDAPIVVAPPVPRARVTVVLGGLALKRFFPGLRGGPGQWQRMPDGRDVLITYSPAYILRFGAVTPAVEKIKREMWQSLKAVRQRISVTS